MGDVVLISGGNDKKSIPMRQGVLIQGKTCLLLSKGHSCVKARRIEGRKHMSVQGCIVDVNLSILNVALSKEEKRILGLKDTTVPQLLGPQTASRV